ncbi:SEL1-like repeat protein [uncultured Tateyamaria sp.]|uniref:tetratricopeptide repeat protein n=1 Tax=Tateyamaria sp. 1078 TaxID=3417464 RepID=UPI00261F4BFE|nr:SEL1-like repeat protein [uncultured Tateyamaria sp.]
MHRLIACLIALSLAHVPLAARSQPMTMDQIEAAFAAGDHDTARAGLASLISDAPSPQAQFRYGRMLLEGLGGAADPVEGLRLLRAAADAGQLGAVTYLGRVHLTAGPTRDPERAARYFHHAAARGVAEAKYYLGILTRDGVGVPQDAASALTWMQAAAEDGYGPAQFELSKHLADATPPDLAQAARWLTEAANAGVPDAQFALAREVQAQGGPIAQVIALFTDAATDGHVPSQRALGTLYLTGAEGQAPDGVQAEAWLRRAVQGRDLVALHNLGMGYLQGTVLPSAPEQAVELLTLASDNGFARSSLALARAYEDGTASAPDMATALQHYRLAVDQGSDAAARRLGALILDGATKPRVPPHDAVPWVLARLQADGEARARDWLVARAAEGVRPAQAGLGAWLLTQPDGAVTARPLLQAAADRGHVPSQFRLGEAYTTGLFGDVDYVAAHGWLNIAAASGHIRATQMRDTITDLMTPDDIAAAQSVTRAFFEAARTQPPVPTVSE